MNALNSPKNPRNPKPRKNADPSIAKLLAMFGAATILIAINLHEKPHTAAITIPVTHYSIPAELAATIGGQSNAILNPASGSIAPEPCYKNRSDGVNFGGGVGSLPAGTGTSAAQSGKQPTLTIAEAAAAAGPLTFIKAPATSTTGDTPINPMPISQRQISQMMKMIGGIEKPLPKMISLQFSTSWKTSGPYTNLAKLPPLGFHLPLQLAPRTSKSIPAHGK
ncbi:MAG: hypothetical protein ACP5O1_12025 [Phycisphaerae bacterium]